MMHACRNIDIPKLSPRVPYLFRLFLVFVLSALLCLCFSKTYIAYYLPMGWLFDLCNNEPCVCKVEETLGGSWGGK